MQLKDAVVVITGASRGFGREMAKAFSREGARVVLSGRSQSDLDVAAKECNGIAIRADVTNEEDVRVLAQEAVKHFGRIDVWINNAGMWLPHVSVENTSMAQVEKMFQVNVFGTIIGSVAALKHMQKQENGAIVNIISTSGLEARAGSSAYAASKFAVRGFTQALRLESTPKGVNVFAVYPGGMKTHLFDEKKPIDYPEFMDPAEVAQKVVANLKLEQPLEELILKRPKP